MSEPKILIAPSILSADFANLESEIRDIEESADLVHLDIMDGRFVPNITIGISVVKSLRKVTNLPFDSHLMIVEPEKYIKQFCDAGANYLSVHAEACTHLDRTLHAIKEYNGMGVKAGVAFNPTTHPSTISPYLFKEGVMDYVLFMTVNPGYGAQQFIPGVLENIEYVRKLNPKLRIEVDGGMGYKNGEIILPDTETSVYSVARAGVTIIVAGNAVFGEKNRKQSIEKIRSLAELGQRDQTKK